MSNKNNGSSKSTWQTLHDAIVRVMDQYGRKSFNRDRDYDMQDADWGWSFQTIELNSLSLLRMDIVQSLQLLLQDYPETHIKILLDIPGTEDSWPAMGLGVYHDRIHDHLVRRFLPENIRERSFGLPISASLVSAEEAEEIVSISRRNAFSKRNVTEI